MLIVAFNPGHDSAITIIEDRKLLFCLEAEKDSYFRYAKLTPEVLLRAAALVDRVPDVVALGGWLRYIGHKTNTVEAGYEGDLRTLRPARFFGNDVRFFSSSHERSHVMAAIGLAPREATPTSRVVLVWEGLIGTFYLLDENHQLVTRIPVMRGPGWRYQFLFGLGDPTAPDHDCFRLDQAGKLMALAGLAGAEPVPAAVRETVERILSMPTVNGASKAEFRDSPLYNAGLTSEIFTAAASFLTRRIYEIFRDAAQQALPEGLPLYISGGCGLNCYWNKMWQSDGFFSSVFVPPCPNDSGSSLGTGIDALFAITGDPHVEWNVYSGLDFELDRRPDPTCWASAKLDYDQVAGALRRREVVAWVQGRWELGPRALGNRSLLAAPFDVATRDRLNQIKQREPYRPIAPVCRREEAGLHFDGDFHDPYMMYFRGVRNPALQAITHADGSARLQTVDASSNERLDRLLSAFRDVSGAGVLCNTSLNFSGRGFINRMSDLEDYCSAQGIDRMVVGDEMYWRVEGPGRLGARGTPPAAEVDDALI